MFLNSRSGAQRVRERTLVEFNHCHDKQDGQFCATPGSAKAAPGEKSARARKFTDASTTPEEAAHWTSPAPALPANWASMSPEAQDAFADATHSIPARIEALAGGGPWTGSVHDRLDQNADKLAPEATRLITGMATDLQSKLHAAFPHQPEVVDTLVRQATDALIAQEIEAASRTLGDHGIHHLQRDATLAREVLLAHSGEVTPHESIMLDLAAAFHDSGYLTAPSRNWQDNRHPTWSEQYYRDAVAPSVEKLFGRQSSELLADTIRTHSDTTMDWSQDAFASSFRLSDNLALFAQEKTPGLFRYVPGNRAVLEKFATGEFNAVAARAALARNTSESALPAGLKSQLLHSVTEVSDRLPKFVAGMWSGHVQGVQWSTEADAPIINVVNEGNNALMKRLDLGQRQFTKLAETYGKSAKDFRTAMAVDLKGKDGKTIALFRLRGRSLAERR